MPNQNTPIPGPVSAPTPVTPPIAPTNQIGATSNPQSAALPASTVKSAPITQEGGYYQSRATDLGLMDQSPKAQKLPEMSVSLGGSNSSTPSYGTGGIMKMPESSGFKKPDQSSFQSGTSLTNAIPNIMADSGVQSSIGNVTQPVTTGLMRGVPKMPTPAYQPQYQNVDLYNESKAQDFI